MSESTVGQWIGVVGVLILFSMFMWFLWATNRDEREINKDWYKRHNM
jgi:hypothetical protein